MHVPGYRMNYFGGVGLRDIKRRPFESITSNSIVPCFRWHRSLVALDGTLRWIVI